MEQKYVKIQQTISRYLKSVSCHRGDDVFKEYLGGEGVAMVNYRLHIRTVPSVDFQTATAFPQSPEMHTHPRQRPHWCRLKMTPLLVNSETVVQVSCCTLFRHKLLEESHLTIQICSLWSLQQLLVLRVSTMVWGKNLHIQRNSSLLLFFCFFFSWKQCSGPVVAWILHNVLSSWALHQEHPVCP